MKPSVLQQGPSLQALFLYKMDAKAMELFKQALDAMKKANIPIAGKSQLLHDLWRRSTVCIHGCIDIGYDRY